MARGRNRKGQFTKRSTALVRRSSSRVTHRRRGGGRRRRSSSGGGTGMTLAKVIAAGLVIGYVTSDKSASEPDSIRAKTRDFFQNTIPGGKTFGAAGTIGASALLVDRFLYRNPWIRVAGFVGVGIAALKAGSQGSDFKWVGDGDDGDFVADVDG